MKDALHCEVNNEAALRVALPHCSPPWVHRHGRALEGPRVATSLSVEAGCCKDEGLLLVMCFRARLWVQFMHSAMIMRSETIVSLPMADTDAGQELLFDYGENYWRGREHLIVE